MLLRLQSAILAILFLGFGGATVIAPHLWEHYGIQLTRPLATNQFVSVVGGAELAIGLLCAHVALTGRAWFHFMFVMGVVLAVIAIVRPVSFFLHGGATTLTLIEWCLEIIGAYLCIRIANKTGGT